MKRTLFAALLVAGSLVTAAPAQAATCASTDVTVVVQFPDGHTEIGCAGGDPDSGNAALEKAGFPIKFAQGNGAGAICRIKGEPSNNNCGSMPPANAYWAYYHAKPGGKWTYSTAGGGSYNPKPGSVEGWRFGDGNDGGPTTAPPGATPPKPTPRPTKSPTKKPSKAPTKAASATPSASATATASASPTSPPSPTASETVIVGMGTPTAMPTFTDGRTPDASKPVSQKADDSDDGGVSWIWGLVLLGALAAAGGTVAVRRRG